MKTAAGPPGFLRTVFLLLAASRRRAVGRQQRARQIFRQQSGGGTRNWGGLGVLVSVMIMAGINVSAAFLIQDAVKAAQRVAAQDRGQVVRALSWAEAERHATTDGGSRAAGLDPWGGDFESEDQAASGLEQLGPARSLPALFGSLVLLWWGLMLATQGEGPELDVLRRRHVMWEWLLSHPIRTGAMFCAEMLAPLAANPLFWTAPLTPGLLYGFVYGPVPGVTAVFAIGIPMTIAAACVGKALEIGALLRLAPRSRGAMLGLAGWVGYASMALLFAALFAVERLVTVASGLLRPLASLPWPWLGLVLGQTHGGFSFASGMLACWLLSGAVIAMSVAFSVWSARRGLSGPVDKLAPASPRRRAGGPRFRGDPLYRKELLWFARDRSAIVQALLVPLTMGGLQLFNLRGLLAQAQDAWNVFCGAAILFGTYFLAVLGPKSLVSEGSALWIALTWPRGLESLLKAKARLWTLLSSGIVALILCAAAWRFPGDIWSVALVGCGWVVFARSMAAKAVTLATVTGPSGETEKVPANRRWAVQLGTFPFAVGVFTQQWPVAVAGIVYSTMTAAAMWENFRARLPYLYDPWSERLPPPPTLMHAMIAIAALVEGGALMIGIAHAFAAGDSAAIVQGFAYGLSAVCVSIGVARFLARRGVRLAEIWHWRPVEQPGHRSLLASLLIGGPLGLVLGLLGRGYGALLHRLSSIGPMLDHAHTQMTSVPYLHASYLVMGVLIAPVAEEFLFRGLLYRALDREWHGWRAVAGSAAFFAIYHPFLSWLPVGIVGMTNAVIFKKTGRLAPAVLLHMVYNAVILG